MNIFTKKYWSARNALQATYYSVRNPQGGLGCLSHRHDDRDFGIFGLFEKKPKYRSYTRSVSKWVYDQKYFNICTQVMGTIGYSLQEGIRFSVKGMTKRMKRSGMINGNGFSYVRAPLDIATDKNLEYAGFNLYSTLPDEVGNQSWEQFSKWDLTNDQIAEGLQYRAPSYRRIRNASEALEAVENGYVLLTANQWHANMNRPKAPDFYLISGGGIIGGHAWPCPGDRANADMSAVLDWSSHQSFGPRYGLGGMARIKSLFGKGMYEVYILDKLPWRTDIDRAVGTFDGYAVKGDKESTIYWIENGTKRAFTSQKAYNTYATFYYNLDQNLINNIPDGEQINA